MRHERPTTADGSPADEAHEFQKDAAVVRAACGHDVLMSLPAFIDRCEPCDVEDQARGIEIEKEERARREAHQGTVCGHPLREGAPRGAHYCGACLDRAVESDWQWTGFGEPAQASLTEPPDQPLRLYPDSDDVDGWDRYQREWEEECAHRPCTGNIVHCLEECGACKEMGEHCTPCKQTRIDPLLA